MAANQEERSSLTTGTGNGKNNAVLDFLGCAYRSTVRLFKGLPSRFVNYIKRKIKEYRNRPKRNDISRVYVVVGYTTKKRVDEKFNAERRLMIMRRGLLVLIFILILFIAVDRVTGLVNYGELSQIFGIESWDEVMENDPFADKTTESTSFLVNEATEATT